MYLRYDEQGDYGQVGLGLGCCSIVHLHSWLSDETMCVFKLFDILVLNLIYLWPVLDGLLSSQSRYLKQTEPFQPGFGTCPGHLSAKKAQTSRHEHQSRILMSCHFNKVKMNYLEPHLSTLSTSHEVEDD